MKKIDTSLVSSTVRQPLLGRSVTHLQEGTTESLDSIVKGLLQNGYVANDVVVLDGCVLTGNFSGAGLAYAVTAGSVYYNGEIYQVAAVSGNISGTNVLIGTTNTTYQSGDPVTMSDSSTANVHQIKTFVISQAGTGTGTKDYSLWKPFLKIDGRATLVTQNNLTTVYADATGLTFTTPNDGKTRKLKLFLNGHFELAGTHIGGGGEARIYNSTSSTELNSGYSFWQLDVGANFAQMRQSFSCEYSGNIAPNSTIKIQFKSLSAAFGIDLKKAVFTYFEY